MRTVVPFQQIRRVRLAAPPPGFTPVVEQHHSPNHGGRRPVTEGCVMHSTRGNAATPALEYQATVNWFANPVSEVSAHAVIGFDGRIGFVVPDELISWHAGQHNNTHLGLELVQQRPGFTISEAQYMAAAWLLKMWANKYKFPLNEFTLREHREMPQGQRQGKTDIGPPYSFERLSRYL